MDHRHAVLLPFLLLLPACTSGAFRSAAATPGEALRCAVGEASSLGYTVTASGDPRQPMGELVVMSRRFPPRESIHPSTGYLTMHAFARPDGARLAVQAERYEERSYGGSRVEEPFGTPGGTGIIDPLNVPQRPRNDTRGSKRVAAGPAALDAQRIREACGAK